MIMEPMAGATAQVREQEERQKFKAGLKTRAPRITAKREREEDDEPDHFLGREGNALVQSVLSTAHAAPAKKSKRGPKGPNPLSVKKPKPRVEPSAAEAQTGEAVGRPTKRPADEMVDSAADEELLAADGGTSNGTVKRKRKRKPKPKAESAGAASAED
jgi:U3 small nucleolar RNA-associated protein 23